MQRCRRRCGARACVLPCTPVAAPRTVPGHKGARATAAWKGERSAPPPSLGGWTCGRQWASGRSTAGGASRAGPTCDRANLLAGGACCQPLCVLAVFVRASGGAIGGGPRTGGWRPSTPRLPEQLRARCPAPLSHQRLQLHNRPPLHATCGTRACQLSRPLVRLWPRQRSLGWASSWACSATASRCRTPSSCWCCWQRVRRARQPGAPLVSLEACLAGRVLKLACGAPCAPCDRAPRLTTACRGL